MRKSNTTFNISLFFIGIILISLNLNSSTEEISKYDEKPTRTLLVKYGEQVFENEKCTRCHVLKVKNEKWGKKSLDGYGGTRSSGLLSDFLINPKSLNPGTRMPSFDYLHVTDLDKKVFRESFANESLSEVEFELAWQKLNLQADSLVNIINTRSSIIHKKSESTALIGFLQSIPRSN